MKKKVSHAGMQFVCRTKLWRIDKVGMDGSDDYGVDDEYLRYVENRLFGLDRIIILVNSKISGKLICKIFIIYI